MIKENNLKNSIIILIKIINPFWSFPNKSRFVNLFEKVPNNSSMNLELNNNFILKFKKKKTFQINFINILYGFDKRTTIMIKNISNLININDIKFYLKTICEFNYLYIPNNKSNIKFIFLNVKNYKDLIKLYIELIFYQNKKFFNHKKNLSINYSNIQGIKNLINTFGKDFIV